jgi:hypothetical protein
VTDVASLNESLSFDRGTGSGAAGSERREEVWKVVARSEERTRGAEDEVAQHPLFAAAAPRSEEEAAEEEADDDADAPPAAAATCRATRRRDAWRRAMVGLRVCARGAGALRALV